jgi:hypothetical protein
MSALRDRMIRDMTMPGFSPRTHEAYIRQVVGLARYYCRPAARNNRAVYACTSSAESWSARLGGGPPRRGTGPRCSG